MEAVVDDAKSPIILRAPNIDGHVRRFEFNRGLLSVSEVLKDMLGEFEKEEGAQAKKATIEIVYPSTLTDSAVVSINLMVSLLDELQRIGYRNNPLFHIERHVFKKSKGDQTDMMDLCIIFGFADYYDINYVFQTVLLRISWHAFINDSWFECPVVRRAPPTTDMSDFSKTIRQCDACCLAQATGTCGHCATRAQVCSSACLEAVHARCEPFSFVVPTETECAEMVNMLFPAKFDERSKAIGFNEHERRTIMSTRSVKVWTDQWKARGLSLQDQLHRFRWAFVHTRLPPGVPGDHATTEQREQEVTRAFYFALLGDSHGSIEMLAQFDAFSNVDRVVYDLFHLHQKGFGYISESFAEHRLYEIYVHFDYLDGLRLLWKSDRPRSMDVCKNTLFSAVHTGGGKRAFEIAVKAMWIERDAENPINPRPGWVALDHLLGDLVGRILKSDRAHHLSILVKHGVYDPADPAHDLLSYACTGNKVAILGLLLADPRVDPTDGDGRIIRNTPPSSPAGELLYADPRVKAFLKIHGERLKRQ